MKKIDVDGDRLLSELAIVGRIGAERSGGVTRLAYTPPDMLAHSWFIEQVEKAGLKASTDAVGNVLALEPDVANGPPLLSGSHLDTVPQGGRFDGMLGVMAALEAVRAIRRQTGTANRRQLGVLVLAAEESSRFGSACLGSRALVSQLEPADLQTLTDADGITLYQAMRQVGMRPDQMQDAARAPGWFHEFVEIHIDQSDDLFRAGVPVGVITGIAAPTRLRILLTGQQAHSGATLMDQRHDALAGAAEVILAVESAARTRMAQEIVGTVGVLTVQPGSMNVIPGRVEMGVDIRGINGDTVAEVVAQVTQAAQHAAMRRGLTAEISVISRTQPRPIAPARVSALEAACQSVAAKAARLVSRSAHDALYLGQHGPVGMLFIRNPAGISHNPAEAAWDDDVVTGASVLATYLAWAATQ
jgi:hydantoinase/carbamoylase family amidase